MKHPSGKAAPRAAPVTPDGAPRAAFFGLLALTFVLGAILGWQRVFSPDTGFHLSSARWILEHHAFPRTDLLTYTLSNQPYVDMQWLFQLGLHAAHAMAGVGGIIAGGIALTLGFWSLLVLRSRQRDGEWRLAACVLLMLFAVAIPWENRPHLLSWIYGATLLLILEKPPAARRRWLPALPAIMLLWANSHSLFVLGIVILAVFVADELRLGVRGDRRLLPWAAGAVVICLVNPYGLRGLTFPLTQFSELQAGSPFKSPDYGIREFLSPFHPRTLVIEGHFVWFQPATFQLVFTALLIAAAIVDRKRIRAREWVLLGAFGYLFATSAKNFPYLVMACFPIAVSGLADLGRAAARFVAGRGHARDPEGMARRLRIGGTAVILGLLFLPPATGAMGDAFGLVQRRGTGFDPQALPVGSCRFLREHDVEGRVLNALAHGGYIHWITRQPVFIHGITEVLGAEFYRTYVAMKQRDPRPLEAALRRWQPTIAVISVDHTPAWLYALAHRPDWRIVYRDSQETMFFHESLRPDIPALPPPRAGTDYPAYDDATVERILREATAKPPPSLRHRLRGGTAYPRAELRSAGCFLQTGAPEAAIGMALAGLDRTPFLLPELLLTLGHAYNARGDYRRADICFDAFLRASPGSPRANDVRRARAGRQSVTAPETPAPGAPAR